MSALMSIFAPMTLPPLDRALGDGFVDRPRQLRGLVDRDLLESDRVAPRHELAHLPGGGVDQSRVADEPSEARPVGDEDDRLIAAHVHGPHGVAVVEDVGRMAARDAAARPSPLPLVRLEPDAHAIGVPVDLPGVTEEELHVLRGHVVGVGLRAAHRLDLPLRAVLRSGARAQPAPDHPFRSASVVQQHAIALLESPPLEAAEAAHCEGRAAPHVLRHVEGAAHRDVGPEAGAPHDLELEHVVGADADALPERHGLPVERGLHVGAGDGDRAPVLEPRPEPARRHLERGGALGVPHQQIRHAEGEVIHRPGRVGAEVEISHPAGIVLHCGLDAAFEHLEHGRPLRSYGITAYGITAYGIATCFTASAWRCWKAAISLLMESRNPRYDFTLSASYATIL